MIRAVEYKLYLNRAQERCLARWMGACCWVYNRALEHRKKAYGRRGESVSYYTQQKMLTEWRGRMDRLRSCPVEFERDALRRVDRGFQAFFRRCKNGERPGYPRFRPSQRYNSLEQLAPGTYSEDGRLIRIPGMGKVRARGRMLPDGKHRGIRIIRRASGWYAHVLVDDMRAAPAKQPVESAVGVDVGLAALATTSDGEAISNPRWAYKSKAKLTALSRRLSRRQKGSGRWQRARRAVARHHERVAAQRRSYCHHYTTALTRDYDLIAVEKLNVAGLARSRLRKSILDCAWTIFLSQLAYKAEWAGRQLVEVDPRGTSQECPECGRVVPKALSERTHNCPCGCHLDRDVAAARVILARALGMAGVNVRGEKAAAPRLVANA